VNTASMSWIRECQRRWGSRINRAHELQSEQKSAKPILQFYEAILKLQGEVALGSQSTVRSGPALREQIDSSSVVSAMPSLLAVIIKSGTETLRSEAQQLQKEGEGRFRTLLATALIGDPTGLSATEDFFARACLQPVAENLQMQMPGVPNHTGSVCPMCGGLAQLSVLRPEGEGASRSLLCSFCLHEWPFRRIGCPWCGEEDKEKLPRYSAEECDYVHVEACDTCARYLKSVDLTKNGIAVPLVDEAALAVLDVWAGERGYTKIIQNLIGL